VIIILLRRYLESKLEAKALKILEPKLEPTPRNS
jgi:hypothetical protein